MRWAAPGSKTDLPPALTSQCGRERQASREDIAQGGNGCDHGGCDQGSAVIQRSGAREEGFKQRKPSMPSGWNRLGRVTFEGSLKAQSVWTVHPRGRGCAPRGTKLERPQGPEEGRS